MIFEMLGRRYFTSQIEAFLSTWPKPAWLSESLMDGLDGSGAQCLSHESEVLGEVLRGKCRSAGTGPADMRAEALCLCLHCEGCLTFQCNHRVKPPLGDLLLKYERICACHPQLGSSLSGFAPVLLLRLALQSERFFGLRGWKAF